MNQASQTISDRIQQELDNLTRAERQLALSILENYPASGLGPLAALAKGANVSAPTVARMVQKLGYKGYADFQAELREELRAGRGPQQVASLQVLHQIARLHGARLGQGAGDDVGDDVAGREEREEDL